MEILDSLQRADHHLFGSCRRLANRLRVVQQARLLSRSADGAWYVVLPLLLVVLQVPGAVSFALLVGVAFSVERPLYWILKNTLRRDRPQQALPGFRSIIVASDQFSFPSGHTSGAFLFTTSLCLVFGSPCAAMLLWALAVAYSRVLLGVHFPGDTLAGAIMGTACAVFTATMIGGV